MISLEDRAHAHRMSSRQLCALVLCLAWVPFACALWSSGCSLRAGCDASVDVRVDVDTSRGNYTVAVNGVPWFVSDATRLRVNQQWYSSEATTGGTELPLVLTGYAERHAGDVFGEFNMLDLAWKAGG